MQAPRLNLRLTVTSVLHAAHHVRDYRARAEASISLRGLNLVPRDSTVAMKIYAPKKRFSRHNYLGPLVFND